MGALPRLVAALAVLVAQATTAAAEEARFALTIDYELLADVVSRELRGTGPEAAVLWSAEDGCATLAIEDVRILPADGMLEIRAAGEVQGGVSLLDWCLFPVWRKAELRIRAKPVVDPEWRLRLQDVRSELLGADGTPTFLTRRLDDVVGEDIDAAVERARLDLRLPVDEVHSVVESSLHGEQAHRARAALASLRPVDATAAEDGVQVEVAMDVPPAAPEPAIPEPALTPEEQAQWEAALANWDAFLTFAVKNLGVQHRDPEIVDALFELFVDGRHGVLAVLATGPRPGEDPVRVLFLESWEAMRGIARRVARNREGDVALHYVRFLAAGDALAALEQLGPDIGIEISADGLRRLARMLDPETMVDPLALSDAPDPALRELFGFHDPPAQRPDPPPPPGSWWRWPSPAVALAGEPGASAEHEDLRSLGAALDRFVPAAADVERYRDLVSRLLDATAASERKRTGVPESLGGLYRPLVRSVAWQESCWRQFVERAGRVTYLESSTDDVGLMQVNRRVWRGVFDLRQLEWNVVYNVDAGAQIVAQLLNRYGQRELKAPGGHPARATYAAYNGGPRAYRRYRTGQRATRYTRIADAAFWKKYQVTAAGGELAHVPCVGGAV
jgi:hypothetical protein